MRQYVILYKRGPSKDFARLNPNDHAKLIDHDEVREAVELMRKRPFWRESASGWKMSYSTSSPSRRTPSRPTPLLLRKALKNMNGRTTDHFAISKDELERRSIDKVLPNDDDEGKTLGRLQVLCEYVEHLMDWIR